MPTLNRVSFVSGSVIASAEGRYFLTVSKSAIDTADVMT
jgi:hypothetical protein